MRFQISITPDEGQGSSITQLNGERIVVNKHDVERHTDLASGHCVFKGGRQHNDANRDAGNQEVEDEVQQVLEAEKKVRGLLRLIEALELPVYHLGLVTENVIRQQILHRLQYSETAFMEDFKQILRLCAKFKERSFETAAKTHIPLLKSCTTGPAIILLGDSMIERMVTTADSPSFHPWPSDAILSEDSLASLGGQAGRKINRLGSVFNAGVGGDKYENILYRLVGDDSEERQLPGLLEILQGRDIDIWVVHAGTNNLHPKRGLTNVDVNKLRLLLEAALRISRPETNLLLTGLFYRKDIADGLVDDANRKLEALVESMNENFESRTARVFPSHCRNRSGSDNSYQDGQKYNNKNKSKCSGRNKPSTFRHP
ncbi:hypothetical protein DL767_006211 [Monosporascus sp. MG133]|nr:hypothetical protein DL767_006211 [Monosporascus sp. MG133]